MTTQPPDDQQPTGQGGAGQEPDAGTNYPAPGSAPNYGAPGAAPNYGTPGYETPGFPTAAGDAPGLGTAPARPASLTMAVRLMFVGAALSVLGMLTTFLMLDQMRTEVENQLRANGEEVTEDLINVSVAVGVGFAVVVGLLGTALWVLMAIMNGKGKKWARTTATVLGVIGILSNLASVAGATGANTGITAVLSVISLLLAIVILVLLWRKENAPYYEAMSGSRFAA